MKRTFILLALAFLLTTTGCDKNPATPVASDVPEGSAQLLDSPALAKATSRKIPTKIILQGEITFADGTMFESATKKEFALPERLWATISNPANPESGPGDQVFYTVDYAENFMFAGFVAFEIWNYPVSNQYDVWDHFAWINLSATTGASFNADDLVDE